MSFKELIKKVESSQEYKEFRKKHPKAILYSAFFILRQACGNLIIETQQLNYWMGNTRKSENFRHAQNEDAFEQDKVATFLFDENEKIQLKVDQVEPAKEGEKREFVKLEETIKTDVEDLNEIIKKELEKNKVGIEEISKVIAVLQKIKGKVIWNITCISGLSLYRLYVDEQGKVLDNKKESILSMMKIEKGKKK